MLQASEVKIFTSSLSGGGFYNISRWSTLNQKELGGFLNYNVMKGATLGVNYLRKREEFSSDIMSVQGFFKPITGTALELEYGNGEKDGRKDDAFAAQLAGYQKWITYNLRYVKAGPDYGGYYRDTKFFSSSINLRLLQKIRIETYMRLEDRNLARDTSQIYVPHNASYQIGAGSSDLISIYYLNNIQQDRFDSSKYRTNEKAIQTRLGYNFSFASVYANMDFGTTKDELNLKQSPYKRLALSASFSPFARQNYSASIEYTDLKDNYTDERQQRLSANLNAWILIGESTQAQLNIYGNRVNASVKQTYSMFEGSIEHILPFNHKVILRGRHIVITPSTRITEDAYALEYEIPIGVPFKRITSVGQLRGSILDEKGRGIANVMINIGDNKVLSDKKGEFYFSALKPGTVFLSVDKASIGYDRITDQPMPMELLINGGEETSLMLKVAKNVTIAGEVILFGTGQTGILDTSTAINEIGGKSGVFLEISNNNEIHRRVSDNKGKFLFTDLRSGEWTFKVIGGDIPAYHTISQESMRIILQPGERKDIRIEIKPRKRTIKMLEGNQPTLQVTPKNEGNFSMPQIPPSIEKKDTVFSKPQNSKPCMVAFNEQRKSYVLQIASSITKKKADSIAKKASKVTGLKTFRETAIVPSVGRRYRVFIAGFKTREEAVAFCQYFNFEL